MYIMDSRIIFFLAAYYISIVQSREPVGGCQYRKRRAIDPCDPCALDDCGRNEPKDPCANNNCDRKYGYCSRTGTDSYKCYCNDGYTGNGRYCTDVNECSAGIHNCDRTNGICTNTRGSFTCSCKTGYTGNGVTCTDINECTAGTHNCDRTNGICTDTQGSFRCSCKPGYTGDGVTCTDIDPCAAGRHNCDKTNGICTNTPGSFTCSCKTGFSGNGVTCTDINECTAGTHNCDKTGGTCTNTEGSYTCSCKSGFSGNGVTCNDINECTAGTHNCDKTGGICTNTEGSFTCSCKIGFTGNGVTCADNDECITGRHNCDRTNGICTNTEGSFTCSCKSGYTGNGETCTDINECTTGGHNCDRTNGICTNTQGSYTCSCKTGFTGNGVTCTDINECADGTHNCDKTGGICTNTPGSFMCSCKTGFYGDGRTCTKDVDECTSTVLKHDCDVNAKCTNTMGSYKCKCNRFYLGDGKICKRGSFIAKIAINFKTDVLVTHKTTTSDAFIDFKSKVEIQLTDRCSRRFGEGQCRIDLLSLKPGSTVADIVVSFNLLPPSDLAAFLKQVDDWVKGLPEGTNCKIKGIGDTVCAVKPSASDFDECNELNVCTNPTTFCTNTVGGYSCTCNAGFVGDDPENKGCAEPDSSPLRFIIGVTAPVAIAIVIVLVAVVIVLHRRNQACFAAKQQEEHGGNDLGSVKTNVESGEDNVGYETPMALIVSNSHDGYEDLRVKTGAGNGVVDGIYDELKYDSNDRAGGEMLMTPCPSAKQAKEHDGNSLGAVKTNSKSGEDNACYEAPMAVIAPTSNEGYEDLRVNSDVGNSNADGTYEELRYDGDDRAGYEVPMTPRPSEPNYENVSYKTAESPYTGLYANVQSLST